MQQAKQGGFKTFDAHDWRIGIVVSKFNEHITGQLLESAEKRAVDYKISKENIDVFYVAGAVEIPLVLQYLAKQKIYQALLAVGCVIRGDTPHFDYVCKFVSEGILRVQLDHDTAIGFGVLTCDNEQQAIERAHLGREHLGAVLQQARILNQ